MPNLGDKDRVRKVLNYPPGGGLDPGTSSQQLSLQKAAEAGAQAAQAKAAQQNQKSSEKKEE
jgi:hypothetical protein